MTRREFLQWVSLATVGGAAALELDLVREGLRVSGDRVRVIPRVNKYGQMLDIEKARAAKMVMEMITRKVMEPLGRLDNNFLAEVSIFFMSEEVANEFDRNWFLNYYKAWRTAWGGSASGLVLPGWEGIYISENAVLRSDWEYWFSQEPGAAVNWPRSWLEFCGSCGHELDHYLNWHTIHWGWPNSPAGTGASVIYYLKTGEVRSVWPKNPYLF